MNILSIPCKIIIIIVSVINIVYIIVKYDVNSDDLPVTI